MNPLCLCVNHAILEDACLPRLVDDRCFLVG